jgi:hypothetical protein
MATPRHSTAPHPERKTDAALLLARATHTLYCTNLDTLTVEVADGTYIRVRRIDGGGYLEGGFLATTTPDFELLDANLRAYLTRTQTQCAGETLKSTEDLFALLADFAARHRQD